MQTFTHYFLHFIAIGAIAWFYDKKNWKRNWLILLATMAVDLDHVFATPLFDPMRCGIGYHPLHSHFAIIGYVLGVLFIKNKLLKLIFIGLLFHMLTDFIDCLWMFSKCGECYTSSEIYKWFN
ncbi:DUF6122 family protein [Salegentibacter salarius]|uniref:Metal-dependent hydrolase n=1 Tax=Salegentibacter salarius TaxID=435906 RepID=A0A2N0TRM2_9FLAO|nr:DUF6122 family protein [Salegentibacter salarius]OEY71800.1 hypothetical protein BHS39_03815 [Salegentibacter salarius]PKD17394.1 hypothetical protein APR40_03815 [Salegentibacter salarius]